MLGMYDYSDRTSQSEWNQAIDNTNMLLTIIYLSESVLKIIARGFVLH